MITFVVGEAKITVIRSLLWVQKEWPRPHQGLGVLLKGELSVLMHVFLLLVLFSIQQFFLANILHTPSRKEALPWMVSLCCPLA